MNELQERVCVDKWLGDRNREVSFNLGLRPVFIVSSQLTKAPTTITLRGLGKIPAAMLVDCLETEPCKLGVRAHFGEFVRLWTALCH